MFVVTVTFTLKEGAMDRFLPLIHANARASLEREPGCARFDVCLSPQGDRVFLYELYDDEAAFAAHKATPHFADFDRDSAALVADKSVSTWSLSHG